MNTTTQKPSPVQSVLGRMEREFTARNPLSLAQHKRAMAVLPGGHSRQTLLHTPFPLTITRGDGAHLRDLDQHDYLDFLGDFTAGLYGHSNAKIRDAATSAIGNGMSYGGVSQTETEFAELICNRIPSVEQIRFCNSGTEACLFAVSLARAVTGRSHVLVFRGAYHGGFMIFGEESDSPLNTPGDYIKCTYNDTDGARAAIRKHGSILAAVIVEPVMGSGGAIPGDVDFLLMLREETKDQGSFLIFDEVMTSRLGPCGVQGIHGILPDMTTLGKFWGGGFNFGAFGGTRQIMKHLDTTQGGTLSQAGTFNNNIVTMNAGLVGARDVYTADVNSTLNKLGDDLRKQINTLARTLNVSVQATGIGAVMNIHFHSRPISSPQDVEEPASDRRRLFHLGMLQRGIYVAQRGLISLGLDHTDADLSLILAAIRDFLAEHRPLLTD